MHRGHSPVRDRCSRYCHRAGCRRVEGLVLARTVSTASRTSSAGDFVRRCGQRGHEARNDVHNFAQITNLPSPASTRDDVPVIQPTALAAHSDGRLYSDYDSLSVAPGCSQRAVRGSAVRGISVSGLWPHLRLVLCAWCCAPARVSLVCLSVARTAAQYLPTLHTRDQCKRTAMHAYEGR